MTWPTNFPWLHPNFKKIANTLDAEGIESLEDESYSSLMDLPRMGKISCDKLIKCAKENNIPFRQEDGI
jgi:hypothetical protein